MTKLQKENERLYAALIKYGNHIGNCPQRGKMMPDACTCGFRAAIAVDHSKELLLAHDLAVTALKEAGFATAEGWQPHDVGKTHGIIHSALLALGETER